MHSSSLWTILASEEAEASSNISLVLPETNELIAGVLAFLIVFYFVWKRALPMINRTLEARQKAVTGQLEDAEKAKNEAESLRRDYEQQLDDARAKGNAIIEEARKAAEQMRADLQARAQQEADTIVAKAREEASEEKSRALSEARREVANLSIDLAERVVGKNLDRETQLGLVDQYIAELERQ